jgi:energy-coupling factor transporter transmembrane protein EcfT
LAFLLIQYDINYYLQGTVAYFLMLVFLYIYVCVKPFKYRFISALFQIPLLFWWGGAVTILFLIGMLSWEFSSKDSRKYILILPVVLFSFLALGSVHQAILPDYRFALLPDAYYLPLLAPPALIYFSWIIFPVLLLAAFLCRNIKITTTKSRIINNAAQLLLVAFLCLWSIPRYNKADSYQLKKLDHYTRTEQWDQIIEESACPLNKYLYICHLN